MDAENIVLIGFMGTGKSAVGRALARALGLHFFDTDQFIEKNAGQTVAEIWEEQGEASFRRLEEEAVREAVRRDRRVVSTGGGAFLNPANQDLLARYGTVIWLTARTETILERVQKRPGKRPILKGANPEEVIKILLERRTPSYQKASFSVDTSDARVDEVVAAIKNRILKIEADPDPG